MPESDLPHRKQDRSPGSDYGNTDLETLRHAITESWSVKQALFQWADSLDTKVVTAVTVGAVFVGLVPLLAKDGTPTWVQAIWVAAFVTWAIEAYFAVRAYRVGSFQVSPDPADLGPSGWLALPEFAYLIYRIDAIGKDVTQIRSRLDKKADLLGWVFRILSLEILLLIIGVIGVMLNSDEPVQITPPSAVGIQFQQAEAASVVGWARAEFVAAEAVPVSAC